MMCSKLFFCLKMSSFYTTNGIEVLGSGYSGGNTSSNFNSNANTSSGDGGGTTSEGTDHSEAIMALQSTVNAIQSRLNNLTSAVSQYETVPSRLNAINSVINALQQNSVNILGYTDNTSVLNNVYKPFQV